jgi:hypothetical protein
MNKQPIIDRLTEVFTDKRPCRGPVGGCYYRRLARDTRPNIAACCAVGAFVTDEQIAATEELNNNNPASCLDDEFWEGNLLTRDQACVLQDVHDVAHPDRPVLQTLLAVVEKWS